MSVPFQFENYRFDYVKIDLSKKEETEKSKISIDAKGIFYNETSTYDLEFIVKVFSDLKKEEAKPYIEIRCLGTFVFEKISSIKEIPNFFYPNSIAIIFPYVRAYVSLVTNQSNNKPIILPTMNLTGLQEILMKNTFEK